MTRARRERGAALMVAMVMIFMLSIMGISSMRGSTLERRMTNNAVQAETVRQGAESATEMVLNDNASIERAVAAGPDGLSESVDIGNAHTTERVELRHIGVGAAPGTSLSVVDGGAKAYFVSFRGIGGVDGVGAAAAISQGAYMVGP